MTSKLHNWKTKGDKSVRLKLKGSKTHNREAKGNIKNGFNSI